MLIKPLASGSEQLLAAVSTGVCPTGTMDANWVIVKKEAGYSLSSTGTDLFGTFNYSSTTGIAKLPTKYHTDAPTTDLNGGTPQAFNSATCTRGIMTVDSGGGDIATMYLTTAGAALVSTANSTSGQFILGFPKQQIAATTDLDGTYAGILVNDGASGDDQQPIRITLTASSSTAISGTGYRYTDVTTGAVDSNAATISLTTLNSPSNGFLTGTVTVSGNTEKIACMAATNVNGSGKKIVNCSGRSPGNNTKLFNFLLRSI